MPLQPGSSACDTSVVICTRNPRADYFARVLEGLRRQTLPLDRWELLVVDNASHTPLASSCDLSWHPAARHIVEHELGVAHARGRGIGEASADLIIFVDDDNVLEEHYLTKATVIGKEWPSLGAWGSGCIRGDFEVEPPQHLQSWLPVREVAVPRWSNIAGSHSFGESPEEAIPWGAGLCVRREIAAAYCKLLGQSSLQITGRLGGSLVGCEVEDTEISFVCCSQGLGVGIFPELRMDHLIPEHRTSEEYVASFAEGTCLSNILLRYKWQHANPQATLSARTLLSVLKSLVLYRGIDREVRLAWVRALAKANKIIAEDMKKNDRPVSALHAPPPRAPIGCR